MPKPLNNDDQALLTRLRSGDEAAFRMLYDRYWQRLLYFACRRTDGDMAEAENMVQDIFVSIWHRRAMLNITDSFEAYLVVSVKYRVIKWLNRNYTESLYNEEGIAMDILDDSTQEYLALDELQARLGELVARLPARAQLIYRMSHDKGLTHRQIAEDLEMTETAVNVTLVRARKELRAGLGSFLSTFLF
ncbi:MAG TPA: sigma-70 family RNA polymerase sigma factor [Mucilaginibacter sp.]|nr:sigma-70 family RNA polymerase sigma factor [Mucilaginibacter sp.]